MSHDSLLASAVLAEVLPYPRDSQGEGRSLRVLVSERRAAGRLTAHGQYLCYQACRFYRPLSTHLDSRLNKPIRTKEKQLYFLLIAGLVQILFSDKADYAATNECVEATRKLDMAWASKLVNAILRDAVRNKEAILAKIESDTVFPDWISRKLEAQWPQQLARIEAACRQPGPLCLRVNALKGSRQEALDQLNKSEIEAKAGILATQSVYLLQAEDVRNIPGFSEGLFSVQDESAQLAVDSFDFSDISGKSLRILDACAAPGGKTAYLAERLDGQADILALDIEEGRLQKIRDNLQRLQLKATVQCADASNTASWWDGQQFDAILIDAPCSASGVFRRQPDAMWHRREVDIASLVQMQQRLLQKLWPLLKPGGQLVYATCSIFAEENAQQIQAFLQAHGDARMAALACSPDDRCEWQLLPQVGGQDGFYIARLIKQG